MPLTHIARSTVHPNTKRRRVIAIGAALVLAVGVVVWLAPWRSSWSPRAFLRGVGDTWPLAFTADGKTFATAGTNGVTLWDTASGRQSAVWTHPEGALTAIGAFSPDSRTFAGVYTQGPGSSFSVELMDTSDGRVIWSVPSKHESICALLFRDDGRQVRVVLAGPPNGWEVLEVETLSGREIARRPLKVPGEAGGSAVSADGRLLAVRSPPDVTIWDLDTDAERTRLPIPTSVEALRFFALSPDGSTLGVGNGDGMIELYDVATGKLTAKLRGHRPGMVADLIRFSPGGTLASCAWPRSGGSIIQGFKRLIGVPVRGGPTANAEVIVIDVSSGQELGRVESVIHPFLSPDGRTLAVRDSSLSIELFDVPRAGR